MTTDLAYADGVMYEALCEIEDSVRGQWVIIPQEERQQVCGHVLKLPGPETQAYMQTQLCIRIITLYGRNNNA